jgi:hypothetical protein
MSRRGARPSRTQRGLVVLGVAVQLFASQRARADDAEARAKDAYDRGAIAYRAGDYERAATEFAAADALAPSPVSLRAAIDAATLADDAILGTELLERTAGRSATRHDADLARVMATARARFAHRTGRIVVHCPSTPCLATVDGSAIEASRARIVAPGVHTVTLQTTGPAEPRLVDVPADQTIEVGNSMPQAPPVAAVESPPPPASGGLSPVWFAAAVVATGAALGLSVWSGVDTLNQHAAFVDAGCPLENRASCSALASGGVSDQTRTTVLIVATGALAVTTAALGLFATRWHGRATATVGLADRGGVVSFAAAF